MHCPNRRSESPAGVDVVRRYWLESVGPDYKSAERVGSTAAAIMFGSTGGDAELELRRTTGESVSFP